MKFERKKWEWREKIFKLSKKRKFEQNERKFWVMDVKWEESWKEENKN